MSGLSEDQVLRAVARAPAPRSLYIADYLDMEHARNVWAGGKGHSPTRRLILIRLRSLEKAGLLKCVGGPDGYYGYEWRVTDAGQAAISKATPHLPSGAAACAADTPAATLLPVAGDKSNSLPPQAHPSHKGSDTPEVQSPCASGDPFTHQNASVGDAT